METKKCTKCEIEKSLLDYYADKQKADKKTSVCKSCINERQAITRKNPKYMYRFRKYQGVWMKKYRRTPKYKLWRAKSEVVRKEKAKLTKQQVMNYYGGKCACCGISEICFLSIDHINNDGFKEKDRLNCRTGEKIRNRYTGGQLYNRIIKNNYPKDLQIHCFNCNTAKQHNGGICPHKTNEKDISTIKDR